MRKIDVIVIRKRESREPEQIRKGSKLKYLLRKILGGVDNVQQNINR